MKNLKRTLLIGFIWGLIFFLWWLNGFMTRNWNFNVFSMRSWRYLYDEFVSGWVISATSDWIFIWTLILAVPVFLIGWNLFLKVKWRETIVKFFKKIVYFFRGKKAVVTKKKMTYVQKKSHKKVRPVPLYTSAKAMERASAHRTASEEKTSETPAAAKPSHSTPAMASAAMPQSNPAPESKAAQSMDRPAFLDDTDFANMALDDIKLPEREPVKEDVAGLLIKAGYQVLADVKMGEIQLDYVAIDADKVLLLASDNEKGDWLADEERFNNEDPLWFSESSHRVSPVYNLMMVSQELSAKIKKIGERHVVMPMLIEKAGNIINAEDMIDTWKKLNVIVCRTDVGGPDELPTVTVALPKAGTPASPAIIDIIRGVL